MIYPIALTQYVDNRGVFFEGWNFRENETKWVSDRFSKSSPGVLRGLHCQLKHPQAKLLTVISGKILDIIVDINTGQYSGYNLVEGMQLLIPNNYLHGFLALEESIVWYKVDVPRQADDEYIVAWDDKDLNIDWPIDKPILSYRDTNGLSWKEFLKVYSEKIGR